MSVRSSINFPLLIGLFMTAPPLTLPSLTLQAFPSSPQPPQRHRFNSPARPPHTLEFNYNVFKTLELGRCSTSFSVVELNRELPGNFTSTIPSCGSNMACIGQRHSQPAIPAQKFSDQPTGGLQMQHPLRVIVASVESIVSCKAEKLSLLNSTADSSGDS